MVYFKYACCVICLLCFSRVHGQNYQNFDMLWASRDTIKNMTALAYSQNTVWVGTEYGLYKVEKDTNAKYIIQTVFPKESDKVYPLDTSKRAEKVIISAIFVKNDTEQWFADARGFIYQIKNDSLVLKQKLSEYPIQKIYLALNEPAIYGISFGQSKEDKMFSFDISSKSKRIDRDFYPSDSSIFIQDWLLDCKGNKWLANSGNLQVKKRSERKHQTIAKYNTYKIVHCKTPAELPRIWAIHIKNNKSVLVLYDENGKKQETINLPTENNQERTSGFCVDNQNCLLVASNSANIQYIDPSKPQASFQILANAGKMAKYTASGQAAIITDMFISVDSSLWIATNVGLFNYGLPKKQQKIAPISIKDTVVVEKTTLKNIRFEMGDSTLHFDSFEELQKIANKLQKDTSLSIMVKGHTAAPNKGLDKTAAEAELLLLSEARARAVVNYLVSKGAPKERINYIGYGCSQLIDTKNGESEKNRRVEIEYTRYE